jgi:hypothetical protein
VRRNPIRKCREGVNITHTNDIHGITDAKLISGLNILWNEGFYHPNMTYVKDCHYIDPIAAFMALKVNVRDDTNPTVKKAIESVNRDRWIAAMQLEWKSITWRGVRQGRTLGKRIQPNHNPRQPQQQVIRTTWQLLQTLDRDGNHVNFKARCCASANMLRGAIQETFSPTVNALTCVLLQNIALIDGMIQESADVTSAFLYPDYPQDKAPLYLTIEDNVVDLLGEPQGAYTGVKSTYMDCLTLVRRFMNCIVNI